MKVLFADKIEKECEDILEKNGFTVDTKAGLSEDEYASIIKDYDVMVVRSAPKVTKKIIDNGANLKIIGRAGVGVDNIDKQAAKEKGIAVMNAPTGNTNAAAEHTLTMLMMLAKHVIHSHLKLKKGEWDRKSFEGIELKGKTLGIIGLGNVGKKVAKVANALEMEVLCFDPFVDAGKMKEIGAKKAELDEIIKDSDFITVHVPLTDKTRNMLSDKEFAQMKDRVRIINVARGGVIDEAALEKAIDNGKVAAAALDVYGQEPPVCKSLIAKEQVICTPHLGASTAEAQIGVAIEIAEGIVDALKNNKLRNIVNGVEKLKK